MSYILELDHVQIALITDLMDAADKSGTIPPGKGMAWGSIRQQLINPGVTSEVIARIKAEATAQAMPQPPLPPKEA